MGGREIGRVGESERVGGRENETKTKIVFQTQVNRKIPPHRISSGKINAFTLHSYITVTDCCKTSQFMIENWKKLFSYQDFLNTCG